NQWSAWEKRPLTAAQIAYATADVRYLHALHAVLARRLADKVAWVREESQEILADALTAARVTPETAWEQVGGARVLEPDALARVKTLARWRQETAISMDRPLGQVLGEKNLLELARHKPHDVGEIRAQKGLAPIAKAHADQILAALNAAVAEPNATRAERPRAASPRAQRWAEMLLAIAHVIADDQQLAARLLATRGDAEAFARAVDERGLDGANDHPALTTWRRDLLGAAWRGWLSGTVAIVGDASTPRGVSLVQR
ncbi:MAG TPA: HRDC domain-containing protein, partial [Kofleriaceae bacterium]